MKTILAPRLEILPLAQQKLWPELEQTPENFILYGGTAIALQLGHRESVDFDFFSQTVINPIELLQTVPYLKDCDVLQNSANTLTCRLYREDPIKISYFGLPHLKMIFAPYVCQDNKLAVATLLDLAGTKALTIQQRSEAKDYIDIDSLLSSGISLAEILKAGLAIFGKIFSPQLTLKALTYFGDGDLASLDEAIKSRLLSVVKNYGIDQNP